MRKLWTKFTFAILTFFIGIGIVSLCYLNYCESVNQQSLLNAISTVSPVKATFENPCDFSPSQNRMLKGEEAVYVAECFIIRNGYTDFSPIDDKSKLTPENVYPKTDEEGMKMRHDFLERKAYSYRNSEIYGGSWEILFRYKASPDKTAFYGEKLNYIGRAVTMDYFGKRIKVQHSDYSLKMPDSKILNP